MYHRLLKEGQFTTEYIVYAGTHLLELSFNILRREGTIFGISVFGKDVTERKRAEQTLRALSKRQEAILAAVPDILMEVDKDKV